MLLYSGYGIEVDVPRFLLHFYKDHSFISTLYSLGPLEKANMPTKWHI